MCLDEESLTWPFTSFSCHIFPFLLPASLQGERADVFHLAQGKYCTRLKQRLPAEYFPSCLWLFWICTPRTRSEVCRSWNSGGQPDPRGGVCMEVVVCCQPTTDHMRWFYRSDTETVWWCRWHDEACLWCCQDTWDRGLPPDTEFILSFPCIPVRMGVLTSEQSGPLSNFSRSFSMWGGSFWMV